MALRVTPLGAGRHVGRSCVLLEIGGARVLLDCGVHVGTRGDGHFPELKSLAVTTVSGGSGDATSGNVPALDAVIITHFHLDHVGALPYLTEVLGYKGPLLMTYPTRCIAPIILEDYIRLAEERGQNEVRYEPSMIAPCFEGASMMQLQERKVVGELAITPYYAGHVLGAVMVLMECRGQSAFYTGDFTTVPDHHLSAASAPLALRPDVMITETTYCTTIRSSKRQKEHDLCRKVQETLDGGGQVLVPVFMMGRSQELCLLLEKHWARAQLSYPIYVVRGMAQKALNLFRLFPSWSSELVRKADRPFQFTHVKTCDVQEIMDSKVPMVVFAGPAMLNGGASLRLFRHIAPERRNLVVFAGYCLPGTLGNEVIGKKKRVDVGAGEWIHVKCQVDYMSHSDHADSRGILQLVAQLAPRHLVLVHGAEGPMRSFRHLVEQRFLMPCSDPAVGETLTLGTELLEQVMVSPLVLTEALPVPLPPPVLVARKLDGQECQRLDDPPSSAVFAAVLRKRPCGEKSAACLELLHRSAKGLKTAGMVNHRIFFRHSIPALQLGTFRAAWLHLAASLTIEDGSNSSRSCPAQSHWSPVELPLTGPLPCNLTLSLSSGLKCHLEAAKESKGRGQPLVCVSLQWSRQDEQHDAVVQFIEAIETG